MKCFTDGENELYLFDKEELRRTDEYWTEERLAGAKPLQITLPAREDSSSSQIEETKPEGSAPVTEADVSSSPFRSGGKWYMTHDGQDFSGSAQFCGDPRLALTAAHCVRVRDTGEWCTNIRFERGKKNRSGRIFHVKAVAVKAGWSKNGSWALDYAFGITAESCDVETLGYKTDAPYSTVTAIGYPFNFGDSERMQRCSGAQKPDETGIVAMLDNPMGGGCSGGAWLGGSLQTPADCFAVGLNSFSKNNDPKEYGPLFDAGFVSLLTFAKTFIMNGQV